MRNYAKNYFSPRFTTFTRFPKKDHSPYTHNLVPKNDSRLENLFPEQSKPSITYSVWSQPK